MLKSVTAVFFLSWLIVHSLCAQIFLGAKAGINSSWVTIDTRNIANTRQENTYGLNLGAVLDYGINDYLSLKAEFLYSQKGYSMRRYYSTDNYDNYNISNSDSWKLSSYYAEIPLLAKYYIEGRKFKIFVNAGFYGAYWFGGQKKASFFVNDLGDIYLRRKEISESYKFDNDYGTDHRIDNRWDVGAVVGGGLSYKLKKGEFFIEGRYTHGFVDINQFDIMPKTYSSQLNRYWTVSLGYLIKIKNRKLIADQDIEEENNEDANE